jgi:hypothetical protein
MATPQGWKTAAGGLAIVLFLIPLWAISADPEGDAKEDARQLVLGSLDSPPDATLRNLYVAAQGAGTVCGEVRDPSGPLRSSRYQRFVADLRSREVVIDPGGAGIGPLEQRIFGKSAATDGKAFAEYFIERCSPA